MTALHTGAVAAGPAAEARGGLTPADLAGLMSTFTEVTAKLEATHAQLRGEVSRLTRELRDANERLERSRRLAALGEMAAGIAHEIRNPLGSISLYARMLTEDLASAPEAQRTAVKIAGGVRRLDEIVTDVLSFARELRVSPRAVRASALMAEAAEACGPRAGLSVEQDDREVWCDPGLVQQALVNLLRNAFDAIDAGGGGGVRLSVGRSERGGRVFDALSVRDDGPGIPPEVIDRMFNPFFTTRAAGTGLGLAIVHRIVDAHGGRVEVFNNEGRGATVELHLPAPASAGAIHASPRPGSSGQRGHEGRGERTESAA